MKAELHSHDTSPIPFLDPSWISKNEYPKEEDFEVIMLHHCFYHSDQSSKGMQIPLCRYPFESKLKGLKPSNSIQLLFHPMFYIISQMIPKHINSEDH